MTIECYNSECPKHEGGEEPLCFEEECINDNVYIIRDRSQIFGAYRYPHEVLEAYRYLAENMGVRKVQVLIVEETALGKTGAKYTTGRSLGLFIEKFFGKDVPKEKVYVVSDSREEQYPILGVYTSKSAAVKIASKQIDGSVWEVAPDYRHDNLIPPKKIWGHKKWGDI